MDLNNRSKSVHAQRMAKNRRQFDMSGGNRVQSIQKMQDFLNNTFDSKAGAKISTQNLPVKNTNRDSNSHTSQAFY